MNQNQITFSFGKNWINYLSKVDESNMTEAENELANWFSSDKIKGSSVLDLGSGSGIHSLGFFNLGASDIISVDYDVMSVEATTSLWNQAGSPANWKIIRGSALDNQFLGKLGKFDIVYSWGVLHHTGDMWNAIKNCFNLVNNGGLILISIYVKGKNYQRDLDRKKRYNKTSKIGKRFMEFWYFILPLMISRLRWRQNPFKWNKRNQRGMNVYNDIVDWLGGLPYEVATKDEIINFFKTNNFELLDLKEYPEGYCNEYLFKKKNN